MNSDSTALTGKRKALRGRLLAFAVVGAILVGIHFLREKIGIEWSASSIQQAVGDFGPLVPIAYVVLVMFRQALVLPSALLLTTAGLLFGAPMGTLLGAVGITLNAFTLFTGARLLGRNWVEPRIRARYPKFEQHAKTAGPWLIALMTGHPMGVLTPFHFAAGVTRMTWLVFLVAVGPAAIVRAACYSFLGANLLDPGSPGLWVASGILVLVALLPLAHPGLRARLFRLARDSDDELEDRVSR
jgi:uncharacterized membrane protein YdjX (TVP38/TMEM64 family)